MGSPDREFDESDGEVVDPEVDDLELDDLELDDLELDVRKLIAESLPVTEAALQKARDALRAAACACKLLPLAHDVTDPRGQRDTDVRSLLFRGHGIAVEVTVTATGDRCELVGRVRPPHPCTAAVVTADRRIELPDRGDSSFHGRRIPRRPSTLVIKIRDGRVGRRYRTAWTAL